MPAKLSRAGVVGWYLVPEPQPSVCLVIVLFTYKPMSRMILVPTPTKARKRRALSPALEVHEDVRGTVFTLDDGRVTRKETVAAKRAKVNFCPSDVRDPLGEWKPTERPERVSVPVDNLPSVSLSDIHAVGGSDDELDGHDNEDMYRKAGQQVGVEAQHHAPYVDPKEQWKATTMNLWSDILFTHHAYQSCKLCPSSSTAEVFKSHPLHVIQRWAGDFWKADTLANVGIIYHLGHFGRLCPFPSEPTKLVVMDINGVHQVEVCSCTCRPMSFSEELLRHGWYPATVSKPQTVVTLRCLDFYRSLCVVGNVNVHDFVCSLENFTHRGGRDWVPDRYKAFMRVVRQYSFLQRCRRSGRIHEPGGIGSTKHGQVAVQCWACPREGVNLPQGWDMVDKKYRLEFYHMPLMPGLPFSRYLFMLILAMDANFRLKSRIRKNSKGTVQLGDGWGFFVPSKEYREYLSQAINDEDVSNCVAFAALVMANLKFCKGLYSNMDFIFWSSIISINLLLILLSYDVGCQYQKTFHTRKQHLPSYLATCRALTFLICIPVWHGGVHNADCQAEHIITHVVGAGATDGEEPEREWALINPFAYFTREMGEVAHLNFLEDKCDYLAYEKNIQLVYSLAKKLFIANRERKTQQDNFEVLCRNLNDRPPEWESIISAWESDGRAGTMRNPYLHQGDRPLSVAEAAAALSKQELAEARQDTIISHSVSKAGMLLQAIKIWTTQHLIRYDTRSNLRADNSEKDANLNLNERRLGVLTSIKALRKLQATFSPASLHCVDRGNALLQDSNKPDVLAENIVLWFPSDMSAELQKNGCTPGLADIELKLQKACTSDELDKVRSTLNTKAQVLRFRDGNVVGQREGTRALKLIQRLSKKVDMARDAYNDAIRRIASLGGDELPKMKPEDVTINVVMSEDAKSRRLVNIAILGSQVPHQEPSKTCTVSWIWSREYGGEGEMDQTKLSEYMRVEWTKACRRRNLWQEEVMLLREEMRRTLQSLSHAVDLWRRRGEMLEIVSVEENRTQRLRSPDVLAGLKAYAAKQQAHHQNIFDEFDSIWRGNVSVGQEKDRSQQVLTSDNPMLDHAADKLEQTH
ncbi:hypothetical protein DL96DRAFT_1825613 [Flagelloscypha sp. PMI_526]|nr:hypothetical protein DL96DRAFT_1825613 [Flagelloscypha sp. PMI_526]